MKYTPDEIRKMLDDIDKIAVNATDFLPAQEQAFCVAGFHEAAKHYFPIIRDLLTENEELRTYHYGQEDCNGCCDRDHVINHLRTKLQAAESLVADYKEVIDYHRRLVRELDEKLNGENAAQQASLCDLVAQCIKTQEHTKRVTAEACLAIMHISETYEEAVDGICEMISDKDGRWASVDKTLTKFLEGK